MKIEGSSILFCRVLGHQKRRAVENCGEEENNVESWKSGRAATLLIAVLITGYTAGNRRLDNMQFKIGTD